MSTSFNLRPLNLGNTMHSPEVFVVWLPYHSELGDVLAIGGVEGMV